MCLPRNLKNKKMPIRNNQLNILLQISLIIFAVFFVYSNSIKGRFVYDDITLVKHNDYIKSWSNLPKTITDDIGSGSGNKSNFIRPVQITSYMLDYSIWKLNVIGYHLTNIILHILVSLCIFWMISLLFYDDKGPLAFLTSLFYAIHPIHTETVAYISGRADSLGALFTLLCIIFYIKAAFSENKLWFPLILVSYVLALFSKEYAFMVIPLLFLYSYLFKRKLRSKELISLLIITVIYLASRLMVLKFTSETVISTTVFQRLPGFFVALTEYIRLLLLPFDLHMGYGNKLFSFYEPRAIVGFMFLFTLLGYVFIKKFHHRLVLFSICWFFVTLLPQSNLYPLNAFMAEHWLYLSSLGFFLILASSLILLSRKWKYLGLILIGGIFIFYSYLTIKQNNYWKEPISFYKRCLRFDPNNWNIYYNLGINLEQAGNFKEAISAYNRALAINPMDINTCYHLSKAYYKIENTDAAVIFLKRAVEVSPNNALVYYWLGNLYTNINKANQAVEAYNKSVQIDQNFALAYISLGKIFVNSYNDKEKAGVMFNQAIILFKKAVEIEPDFGVGQVNLAIAYYYTGQYDLAIKHSDKAVQLGYEVEAKLLDDLKPFRKEK